MEFNFTGLNDIFWEAVRRHEPTIAFAMKNGRGRFVFLIFAPSDKDGKVNFNDIDAYIVLSRTQKIIWSKLKGYKKGQQYFFEFPPQSEQEIREELGIVDAQQGHFSFSAFLEALNSAIPKTLPLEVKVRYLKANRDIIVKHCAKHIDSSKRVFLLSHQPLPANKKPRDETLMKLSWLTKDEGLIASLIKNLKRLNWTLKWTDVDPGGDRFADIWEKAVTSLRNKTQQPTEGSTYDS